MAESPLYARTYSKSIGWPLMPRAGFTRHAIGRARRGHRLMPVVVAPFHERRNFLASLQDHAAIDLVMGHLDGLAAAQNTSGSHI